MRANLFRLSLLLFLSCCTWSSLWATHNRAGEITVEQIGDCNDLTIRATITTYTQESSINADRDSLTLCWGDGTCEVVQRSNGLNNTGQSLGNDIKKNIYVSTHSYPGRGTYKISMTDPNRNAGIINVNFPNSETVEFHLETVYTFLNPQFQGCNSTPTLLQPPIDIGCVGQPFIHNPNAFDPDGDSLSYHFITPLRGVNTPVERYRFPNTIGNGPNQALVIDEVTGDIRWENPQEPGEYNLAMIIVEHRNGIPIDTMIRDMQITVEDCDNLPPEIELPFEEICVIAGELIDFEAIATPPASEPDQLVELTARGGPFAVEISPAEFIVPDGFNPQPVTGRFRWQTRCEHISDQFYSVVFRAVDNFLGDTTGLATLRTIRIKVVGPPPEDVQAEAGSGEVTVTWESPYSCEITEDDSFQGFSIWRRESSNQFPIDTCTPGLEGKGYTRLAFNLNELNADDRYTYLDRSVERGRTYCYRILGEFAQISPNGNYLYNRVQSLPSNEICVQLSRDVPLLTNVSVNETDENNGAIEVRWSKPKAEDLDTLMNPGPYRYRLLRGSGLNATDLQPIAGADFSVNSFAAANDTFFVDQGLNTVARGYTYQVEFYVNNESEPLGSTRLGTSIFLTAAPTDEQVDLSWEETVPWDNLQYVVYELDEGMNEFVVLDTVIESTFMHQNLENGVEYCYLIESIGSYGVNDIVNPIVNFSQEVCTIPIDNIAPCEPELTVSNICDDAEDFTPEEEFENTLNWSDPREICPELSEDLAGYNIYYAPSDSTEFSLLERIDSPDLLTYIDQPDLGIAGCYVVTAFDSTGNESVFSNVICVDNCPSYELPNAFTPNGDGQNELFIPYPFRFIAEVEFQVFNRWGALVFETSDPNLNWDGRDNNGNQLAEGVYFYACRVFERRVDGVMQNPEILKGYIELIRGQ
ncbi:MAG: gliding motility-associated C-terminal domain-containing protein [Saprospiraceae bacterium]